MILKAENLSFSYKKGVTIIDNLNFEAHSGDLIAVLGPNGAGKTTLLKCIMGFRKIDSGRCLLDGTDIRRLSPRKLWRRISYVPQAKGTASALKALEMIMLGLTSRIGVISAPTEEDASKARSIAESLGIGFLLDKKCNEMSGGELQMVLIARALASEPELLILDEPESNLDFRNQLIVLDTLSKLSSSGICVIFNTHFPEHALTRANKALILHKGGRTVFGETSKVVTEENIAAAFGVEALIREVETSGNTYKSILPLGITDKNGDSEDTDRDGRAIGVVSVIFSDFSLGTRINEIFTRFGEYIVGRMGMPYNAADVYIINVTVDAPCSEIESLRHELAILPGVNVKATVSDKRVRQE